MKSGNPVETVAASVYSACLQDLLPTKHEEWVFGFDKATNRSTKRSTGLMKEARPTPYNVEVTMFEQTWSSTALGFGGIGGQAITSAYTVVVEGPMGDACVYFAGRLAYHIERPSRAFREDLYAQTMRPVAGAKAKYEAPPQQGGA